MSDGIGLAEVLLGLPGFRVLDVVEDGAEVVIRVETTATQAFCRTCGARAEPQDRMRVDVRDLACFGRPARLVWSKRRWRCRERLCPARTWTEHSEHVDAQVRQNARVAVVSTRITTSSSRSTTSRTRNPGSPNSTSARPIPSLIVRGLLVVAAVEQPQRWRDP